MLFLLPGWARARDVDYRGTPSLFVVSDASAGPSIPTSPCVSDPQGPAGAASIPVPLTRLPSRSAARVVP